MTAHLIGIGGTGMTALAEVLAARGWRVSGSDVADPDVGGTLRRRGVRVFASHAATHVPRDADVVVYSGAITAENVERRAAADCGLTQLSYAQMLGQLMQDQTGICIAGTHGKSTTTAMTAHVLAEAGMDPTAIVGAHVRDWQRSGRAGQGPYFVVESCEYQRNFLHLRPTAAAILGIEPDHFDCYPTVTELVDAFRTFAARVPASGLLLINGRCGASGEAAAAATAPVETFSLDRGADWWAADLRNEEGYYRFRVFRRGLFHFEVRLPIPGRHSVLNALAATALADWAGVRAFMIRDALEGFHGLRRRFETLGHWRGVTLVDDYAHHPTEVQATLRTAREVFGGRRIWCVFQPHQVSRTASLRDEFAASFHDADRVFVNEIYKAREVDREAHARPSPSKGEANHSESGDAITASQLAALIGRRGVHVLPGHGRDEIVQTLQEELQPGDVLITMGAGDVGNLNRAFLERLSRDSGA